MQIATYFGGSMKVGERSPKILFVPLCLSSAVLVSACADLVVTRVNHEPFLTTARAIKATVKNEGWRDAPASSTRLDVKPAGASSFTRSATISTPPLARGQEIELMMSTLQSAEIPATGSGQCLEMRACADSADVVGEGWMWEGNNCRTTSDCR